MMRDFLKEVGNTEVARDSLKIEVNKLRLYSGVRKMVAWSDLPKASSEWAL